MSCVVLAGGTQVVGMSATLSNISDLASFLKADTFSSQFRPVSYIVLHRDPGVRC